MQGSGNNNYQLFFNSLKYVRLVKTKVVNNARKKIFTSDWSAWVTSEILGDG